jgi:tyrosinase
MMAGRLSFRAVYALLASLSLLSVLCAADAVSDLAAKGRPAVDAVVAKSTTCTKDKLQVRREWYVVSISVFIIAILTSITGAT